MGIKHFIEKGAIYYTTSVTKNRKEIFTDIFAARFLLVTIAYHRYILGFSLFGYVIMPDHFHILIQPSDDYPLPKIMNYIKGNFARKYNFWHNQKGHVWQEGYYETALRKEKDIIEKLNYTHNNPVRQGLVQEAKDYEFSSYHQYYSETREKIQIPIDKLW